LLTTPAVHDVPADSAIGTAQLLMSQSPHCELPMQTTLPGVGQGTELPEQLPEDEELLPASELPLPDVLELDPAPELEPSLGE
jgi:hypothetical protein